MSEGMREKARLAKVTCSVPRMVRRRMTKAHLGKGHSAVRPRAGNCSTAPVGWKNEAWLCWPVHEMRAPRGASRGMLGTGFWVPLRAASHGLLPWSSDARAVTRRRRARR